MRRSAVAHPNDSGSAYCSCDRCAERKRPAALIKERIDRSGAQFGLELRAPMHRRKYVEWAFRSPERMHQRGGISKYVHIQALAGLLPMAVVCRKKAAFSCFGISCTG